MTAQELIASSLRLCGAIAGGEVPTASEFDDGLAALRDILESWTTEGLTPFSTLDQTFQITDGVRSYTIGPGATWNGYRPVRIKAAKIGGAPVPVSQIEYSAAYPIAVVTLPELSSGDAVLTSEVAFVLPDSSTDELAVPPGYILALRFALASDLAPEYGLGVDPAIERKAINYKAALKRANIRGDVMPTAPEMSSTRSTWDFMQGL